ncbi:RNA polymerase sigma factor [Caldanaerobacter subterraneus]|uniref:RNA polymerase sigma-70 factor (ECF subfamily) n=1 Tax=Caldanaerobacter subterraneus TaxID=911092 RepID=A0A4R2JK91_9THEO|nr:sigma-70 family RNA polymerase sigma factor [Caldanaerobacter subterraneus]TCO60423.1 RNA polymerase sigma-70 factor (ECF subfamily) [Caldanaerobacter subterraneus]
MDIKNVVKKIQKGDFKAFDHLIKLQSPKALKTAYLITGEKHIAEECVQEAFLQCYQKIYQLKKPEVFESWFYKILTRICWNVLSKNKNTVSLEAIKETEQDFSSEKDNVEENFEEEELKQLLIKTLYTLEPHYRTVIVLRF